VKSIKKYHLITAILVVFLSAISLSQPNTCAGEEPSVPLNAEQQDAKISNENTQYVKDGEKEPGLNVHLGNGLKAFFLVDLPKGDKTEELLSKIRSDDMNFTSYRAFFGIRIPL